MDLKFASEFAGLAFCLHPRNPSLFVLTSHSVVLELDLYTKAICRTYNCPQMQSDKSSKGNERYFLLYIELREQLLLVSPCGLAAFFDYESSALLAMVRLRGRYSHCVGTFCVHPRVDRLVLFYTAESLKRIYAVTAFNIQGKIVLESKKRIQKLGSNVLQLGCHPTASYIYGACADGRVHVWDYEHEKEVAILAAAKAFPNRVASGSCLSVDSRTRKLVHGSAHGYVSVWDVGKCAEEHVLEFVVRKPFGVQAVNWLAIMHSDKYQYLLVTFSNGSLTMFKYVYAEGKSESRIEETCTLLHGEENFAAPFSVDRSNFIMTHPSLPFIASAWLQFKDAACFKSTVFLVCQGTSQGTEIANDQIFCYSVLKCKAKSIADFRKLFGTSISSCQKFDSRPKGIETPTSIYRFLIVCTLFTGEHLCTMISYNAVEDKFSESVKQLTACDACFLGTEAEKSPAIALLTAGREHVMVCAFNDLERKYGKVPQGQLPLSSRIRNVYRSPINDGFTVVYQLHKEHALKFSKNRKDSNTWDLDTLSDPKFSLKLKYDEVALDLTWQHTALCAVNTNQRILIVDDSLTLLHEFSLASLKMSSTVTSSWWLGNTLLFTNYTHLFYLVPSETFAPCAVVSFPEPRILAGALLDRTFTFQQGVGQKAPGINILPITLCEPLLVGYLAQLKGKATKAEAGKVAELLARITSGLISDNLIRALNGAGMNSSAMELVSRPSNSQFTKADKVEQAISKGDYKKAIELLAGIREGSSPTEEAIVELMLQAYSDPTYKFEKEKLREIMRTAVRGGQYRLAFLCAEFLNDQVGGYRILAGLNNTEIAAKLFDSLKPQHSENVMQTDLECLINAYQRKEGKLIFEEKTLRNWKIETPLLKDSDKFSPSLDASSISKLKIEDKKIVYQTQQAAHGNALETKDLPTVKDSSLAQWFGYDLILSSDSAPQKPPEQYLCCSCRLLQNQASDVPTLPLETTADNLAEADHLLCYYRLDEGPGTRDLADAGDKGVKAVIATSDERCEKVWGELLPAGNPLEHEDRWGAKVEPSRCLKVDRENYVRIPANDKLAVMRDTFTVEIWVKIENVEADNFILQSANDSFAILIKEDSLIIKDREKEIKVQCDETIASNKWVHLAVVWHCNAEKPIQLLINGRLAGSSGEKIRGRKWVEEDINVGRLEGEVTEIRVWGINLSERVVDEIKSVPLSVLANRQGQLKVSINKPIKNVESEKKKGTIGAPKKAALPPPKSAARRNAKNDRSNANKKVEVKKEAADIVIAGQDKGKTTDLWKEEVRPNNPVFHKKESMVSSIAKNSEPKNEIVGSITSNLNKNSDLFKMDMNDFDAFSDPPLNFNEPNSIIKSFNDLSQSKKTSTISPQTLKDSAFSIPTLDEVQEPPAAESEQTSSSFKAQSDASRLSPSHKSSVAKGSRVGSGAPSLLKGSVPLSASKEQVRGTVMSSPGQEFSAAKSPEQPTKAPEKVRLAPMGEKCNVSDSLKSSVPGSSTHAENLTPNSKASTLGKEQGEARILVPNESLARPSELLAAKDDEKRAESDLVESVVVARDKTVVSPNRQLTRAKDKDISVVSNEQIEEVKVVSKASATASGFKSKDKLEEDKALPNVSKAHKITLSKRTEVKEPMIETKSPPKAESVIKPKEQPKVSSPVSEPSPLKSHSITSVIADITSGNVAAAGTGVEAQLKSYASKPSLDANEKKVVAILSRYKFVVKVLERMEELQQSDAGQSADLANVLTRVKLEKNMGIGNYASALRCVNYALMDSGLGDDDRKAIKEKMEVDLNLSARSVKNRGRWMQCRAK